MRGSEIRENPLAENALEREKGVMDIGRVENFSSQAAMFATSSCRGSIHRISAAGLVLLSVSPIRDSGKVFGRAEIEVHFLVKNPSGSCTCR